MNSLSAIILTYNEEKHIERCIRSLLPVCSSIHIIDSFSTDRTVEIAQSLGARVYQNPWVNYADQFNWALDNLQLQSEWLMRMDADEYLLPELQDEICSKLGALTNEVSGVYLKRRVYCLGSWIRHGGYYPTWLLRIWRTGNARLEQRWMDEHVKISSGSVVQFAHDIVDENLNNLDWWTTKHNGYATREAIDLLNMRYGYIHYDEIPARFSGTQEQRRRWLKQKYAELPLFIRPFFYFLFRYVIKAGFLDGRQGLVWHFLQGFWYRFLVDAKLYEVFVRAGTDRDAVRAYIAKEYGITL